MGDDLTFQWPGGAAGAASLAYDGGLPEHREVVLPLLDELGLKGTFFLAPEHVLDAPNVWRKALADGHEIGNGCLVGVTTDGELPNWSKEAVHEEFQSSQEGLQDLLGVRPKLIALPGTKHDSAGGDYLPLARQHFEAVRLSSATLNDPNDLDEKTVLALPVEIIEGSILSALHRNRWTVFTFGRMFGPEHDWAAEDHRRLVEYLAKQENMYCDTVGGVLETIRKAQAMNAVSP